MIAVGLLLVLAGTWLVLQAVAGDLARRLLSWRNAPLHATATGDDTGDHDHGVVV